MPAYIWFILAACFLYAVENIIIERHLSHVSGLVMMTFSSMLMIALSGLLYLTGTWERLSPTTPASPYEWRMALLGTSLACVAGLCFFKAYNAGGNATVIPIVVVSMPVFAIAIKSSLALSLPSWREMLALVLVAIAVWLASPIKQAT